MHHEGEDMKRIPDEAAKEVDREFEEAGQEAKNLPRHGSIVGSLEFTELEKRHPSIWFFVEYFGETSDMDPETKNAVGSSLRRFLHGEMSEREIHEFVLQHVEPFYQDFFENAPELLGLESEEYDEFLQLEVQYRKKKHHLTKEEGDKLDSYMSRFYKKRVEEQEKKKAV